MEAINVSSIFREENLKKSHNFGVNDQVIVKFENEEDLIWVNNKFIKQAILSKQPFFITSLGRDCDGTPLYSLSLIPIPEEDFVSFDNKKTDHYILKEMCLFNPETGVDGLVEKNKIQNNFCISALSEDYFIPYKYGEEK